MSETLEPNCEPAHELLAFRLGNQEFCIDVMSIREIRGWAAATPLPGSAHVRGVLTLRGAALPIIDLASLLGDSPAKPTARHAVIVAEIGEQTVGLLIEAVSDIFPVTGDAIQPLPDTATDVAKRVLRGVISLEARLISFIAGDSALPVAARQSAMSGA